MAKKLLNFGSFHCLQYYELKVPDTEAEWQRTTGGLEVPFEYRPHVLAATRLAWHHDIHWHILQAMNDGTCGWHWHRAEEEYEQCRPLHMHMLHTVRYLQTFITLFVVSLTEQSKLCSRQNAIILRHTFSNKTAYSILWDLVLQFRILVHKISLANWMPKNEYKKNNFTTCILPSELSCCKLRSSSQ